MHAYIQINTHTYHTYVNTLRIYTQIQNLDRVPGMGGFNTSIPNKELDTINNIFTSSLLKLSALHVVTVAAITVTLIRNDTCLQRSLAPAGD